MRVIYRPNEYYGYWNRETKGWTTASNASPFETPEHASDYVNSIALAAYNPAYGFNLERPHR